jgi:hypothetical protein
MPQVDQVWPESTRLTWLTWSLALNNPNENLGRHSLPPLKESRPEIRQQD